MEKSQTRDGESQAQGDEGGESRKSGERSRTKASQVEDVVSILKGKEPGSDDDGGDEGSGGEGEQGGDGQRESDKGKAVLKTIDDAAERLGVEVKDLYALTFNMGGDGESHTIGDLKDAIARMDSFELERLEFEETKRDKESEQLRAQAELNELISMLPKEALKPAVIEKVRERHDARVAREAKRTLAVIPEWRDEDRQATEKDSMREYLGRYGFPTNYLETIHDHRTLKLLRDAWQQKQRVDAALSKMREVNKTTSHKQGGRAGDPPKKGGEQQQQRQGPQAKRRDQIAQVRELLRTG